MATGAAGANAPMASVDLAKRVAICESFVFNGVIDPLVMGNVNTTGPSQTP